MLSGFCAVTGIFRKTLLQLDIFTQSDELSLIQRKK